MSHYATATISEAHPLANPMRSHASNRVRAHHRSSLWRRLALVPHYLWDELEPAQLQQRSEWHDPGQPGG
jgi:hypothetical protein